MTASARRIQQLLSWLGDRDRQLQLALDAAELGTWNWDPSTNELVWSDRCRTLIGVSAAETPTVDTFLKLVHADDRPAVEHAIASALRDGDSYSIEYRIVLPDGDIRWLHSLGRVHRTDSHGRTLGMSGVVRDVTVAHRQEQYLEQLRRQDAQQRIDQRYRLLVDTLPLGIMLSDPDGVVTYVNPAWTILGATRREQVIGQEQMGVVHPQDRVRVHSLWQRLRQELTADFEFRVAAEGGEPRWVRCISTALRDGNGIVLGFAHACADISGHRQQRAAIELRHDQVLGLAHRLQRLRQSERLDLAGLLQREIVRDLGTARDALAAIENAASLHDARSAASRAVALIASTTERLRRIVHELNPP
ncbi:MAG: PAS domain-containing protein, partial [Proteobacteria bacterium]|nr:PAS domain-containing protein [Pseudomonadota bacterium]